MTVTAAGLLLLMCSACGSSKPAATEASSTPAPTLSAASATPAAASPTVQPSASIAPTPAPSASKEPSATATPAPAATVKPTTAPTVAPTAAATPTPKPAATPAPSVKAPEGNAKAAALFKANCMTCHGANLEGDFGPNLTKVGSRLSKDQITAQITNGGGDMPAQGKNIAAADIEILAAWLAGMK
jgi:mono/diheme cytochrome c family protein